MEEECAITDNLEKQKLHSDFVCVFQKVTWGASVSVSTGVDVKAPFVGGLEVDVTVEQSYGGEHSWSLENMKGKETTSGAYAHQYMKFVVKQALFLCASKRSFVPER